MRPRSVRAGADRADVASVAGPPRGAQQGGPSPGVPSAIGNGEPVLIAPGFLFDASQFEQLASDLRARGFLACVAPIRWYHWLPTVGGRSMRPILDRLDASIDLLRKAHSDGATLADTPLTLEGLPEYSPGDFAREMRNASLGARHAGRFLADTETPRLAPPASDAVRVALVAHSAAGWIARILLGGGPAYWNKTYDAAARVHTLLTLGTPHYSMEGVTKRNLEFVNGGYAGCVHAADKVGAERGVRYVCVAGRTVRGEVKLGGFYKDLPYQSYELCTGSGDAWGDGVTPVECALGLDGAETLTLEGVEHVPVAGGRVWYGTAPEPLDAWAGLLVRGDAAATPAEAASSRPAGAP
ncbi:unnamed protein product [Pedinophyceae sp. YPF-701]|nr:unnamed protein product [Pedinophyceae sp. YPF-701]